MAHDENIERLLDKADQMLVTRSYSKAFELYDQAIELDDSCDEAYLLRGQLYANLGNIDKALKDTNKALSIDQKYDSSHFLLAQLHMLQGNTTKAIYELRQTLTLNKKHKQAIDLLVPLLESMADKQLANHQPDKAVKNYHNALELMPKNAYLNYKHAFALARIGDFDQAIENIDLILKDNSQYVPAKALLVTIYEKIGEVEKGWNVIESLAQSNPDNPTIIISFGKYALREKKQHKAIDRLLHVLKQKEMKEDDLLSIHMLLGKLFDSMAKYEKAIHHFDYANSLKYNDYDIKEFKSQVSCLTSYFTRDIYSVLPFSTNETHSPIFIFGMPRSGTSLIEQIVSSHSSVYGGGELQFVPNMIHKIQTENSSSEYPQTLGNLSVEQLNSYASQLLLLMESLSPESKKITDKLPHNFLFIGFLYKLFPNAKFINCLRNPIDNCLSCYFQHFGGYHPYAYDLSHLAEYYKEYMVLMKHWQNELEIPVLDVQYEELVGDTESEIAIILDYLGLDWEDDCMEFYRQKRVINTASYTQVNRKVYSDSMNRWKHYKPYIGDLIKTFQ